MAEVKCYVAGWDSICGLLQGHDGAHRHDRGPGCTIWWSATPRWDGTLNRWVKPDEPDYEAGLERLRDVDRRLAAFREEQRG